MKKSTKVTLALLEQRIAALEAKLTALDAALEAKLAALEARTRHRRRENRTAKQPVQNADPQNLRAVQG